MYHMCVPGALISREGDGSPKTGVTDSCEPLHLGAAVWMLRIELLPLQEQQMFLTTEPSLWFPGSLF